MKRKWRVDVWNSNGSWILDVEAWYDNGRPEGGWDRHDTWRLTPSFGHGLYVLPVLWFKLLKERVSIAVRWAVEVVVRREGLDSEAIENERLAAELTQAAMEAFEKALSERGGE